MFCALKGTTATPRRASARHMPVTTSDLPTSEDVPAIRTPLDVRVLLPTGAVYGVSTWRPAVAGTASAMFGLRRSLSNRDLLGGSSCTTKAT
jgi:hypothetical protein